MHRMRITRALRLSAAAVACTLGLAACNSLLKIQDPDVASPGSVSGKDKLPTQLAGALSDFQVGFDGVGVNDYEGLVNLTGLLADEFNFTETFPTRIVIDQRNLQLQTNNTTLLAIYFNIQKARASGARAVAAYQEFDPGNPDEAEALSVEALSQLMMAETYCGAVPFSSLNPDGSIANGTPLTTVQMLQTAVATFDSAITIAVAGGDANREYVARIGKARALLDLGGTSNIQEADTVVATVPTTYQYLVRHSLNSVGENNGVWEFTWSEGRWSVADDEGENGLPFRSANDPRLTYTFLGTGFASNTLLWAPNKYGQDSNVVVASGVEARLIQAEAALNRNDVGTWLTDLNTLRTPGTFTTAKDPEDTTVIDTTYNPGTGGVAGLRPLTDPGTPDGRIKLTFSERAFWLYATGHRLGDLRRMARSVADGGYGYGTDAVFPTGPYHYRGSIDGSYGESVAFPIPQEENNNPSFVGTTCDTSIP